MSKVQLPKGRRWLKEDEIIRKGDRFHCMVPGLRGGLYHQWHLTGYIGQPAHQSETYSRAIPRKKKKSP